MSVNMMCFVASGLDISFVGALLAQYEVATASSKGDEAAMPIGT